MINHLGDGSATKRDHRRPAGHGFDHHQAKRLGPVNRKKQGRRASEKTLLGLIVDFADQFNPGAINERFEPLLEIGPFAARPLKSKRPCKVVTNGTPNRLSTGRCNQSIWACITSKSEAW